MEELSYIQWAILIELGKLCPHMGLNLLKPLALTINKNIISLCLVQPIEERVSNWLDYNRTSDGTRWLTILRDADYDQVREVLIKEFK